MALLEVLRACEPGAGVRAGDDVRELLRGGLQAYDAYVRRLGEGVVPATFSQFFVGCGDIGGYEVLRNLRGKQFTGRCVLAHGGSCVSCVCGAVGVNVGGDLPSGCSEGVEGVAESVGAGVSEGVTTSGVAGSGSGGSAGGGAHGDVGGSVDVGMPADGGRKVYGKHYFHNRRKKELRKKRKEMQGSWRASAGADAVSESGSSGCTVQTVDTCHAERLEAQRTLALRRVAENRVAEQRAVLRLASLKDEKKAKAVLELQVQRMNASINAAKAKSQACYAKCDNSLKSLGSAGSAGEFAWKKTEADLAASREEVKNLRAQMDIALAVGGPEIFAAVAEVPEPKKYGIRDVLGEPGANWTEEEIEAYYDILNAEAIGNYSTNWEAQFPRSFWDRKAKENF